MSDLTVAEVLEIPKAKGKYGKGSIVKRGDRYQISFYDNDGRRRRESYSTEAKAERALRQKLVLKETGKLDAAEIRTRMDALADLYLADRRGAVPKSIDWLESVWDNHLKPFFGGFLVSRIKTDKLVEYRNERLKTGASPTTVNKEMTVLRAMFYHGLNYDPPKISHVTKFPEKLKEPAPRSGFITDEQYDALQAHCKHHWLKALLAIAYTYGFRKSELVGRTERNQPGLRVRQVDLKNRTIDLNPGETKNDEGRVVKMTEEAYNLLRPCVEGKKPDDAVFTWENGRPVKDFRGAWDKMTEAAKVPVLVHDFRRSAARNLVRAGVNRDVAKRITGHKTDSIFSRYNIVDEADLAEAADKLEARRKSS
jgi:integrase